MFEGLFAALRAEGVPVAMDEWLALQAALERGLAGSSLSGLYLLGRAVLVKRERHLDAYDAAFSALLLGPRPGGPGDRRPRVGVAGRPARGPRA